MRRFTRGLLRKKLDELSEDFNLGSTLSERFARNAIFFLAEKIPLMYDEDTKKYKILYQSSILGRLIPEDDETLFDKLNALQSEIYRKTPYVTYTELAQEDPRRILSEKILLYLELQGYTVKNTLGNQFLLKDISE